MTETNETETELTLLRRLKQALHSIYTSMVYAAPEMQHEWIERMSEEFVDHELAALHLPAPRLPTGWREERHEHPEGGWWTYLKYVDDGEEIEGSLDIHDGGGNEMTGCMIPMADMQQLIAHHNARPRST